MGQVVGSNMQIEGAVSWQKITKSKREHMLYNLLGFHHVVFVRIHGV